jgi:hypothetical protein
VKEIKKIKKQIPSNKKATFFLKNEKKANIIGIKTICFINNEKVKYKKTLK